MKKVHVCLKTDLPCLPSSCCNCSYLEIPHWCTAVGRVVINKTFRMGTQQDLDDAIAFVRKTVDGRPDWCPLVEVIEDDD